MPPRKEVVSSDAPIPPPAKTIEGREHQLVSAAFDLVEKRIHAGTASAQETVHFLKLGSVTHQLEKDKLRRDNELMSARIKDLESKSSNEELLGKALAAFKGYSGQEPIGGNDEDPDVY